MCSKNCTCSREIHCVRVKELCDTCFWPFVWRHPVGVQGASEVFTYGPPITDHRWWNSSQNSLSIRLHDNPSSTNSASQKWVKNTQTHRLTMRLNVTKKATHPAVWNCSRHKILAAGSVWRNEKLRTCAASYSAQNQAAHGHEPAAHMAAVAVIDMSSWHDCLTLR